MAASRPKMPSPLELIELMAGPRVDIYIGPERQHYSLPKNLVCRYSKYFDRCFNGGFREAETQSVELSEDTVADFDLIVEYLVHHQVSGSVDMSDLSHREILRRCMEFIKYVSKYDLAEVSDILQTPLQASLAEMIREHHHGKKSKAALTFEVELIDTIFRLTTDTSPLRDLMARAVLVGCGPFRLATKYPRQIDELDGFAAAVLRSMSAIGGKTSFYDSNCATTLTFSNCE